MGQKKEKSMSGSMALRTIVITKVLDFCVFRWFISNYSLLETGRLFYQEFKASGFDYYYKLVKQKGKLYIGFQCEYAHMPAKFYLFKGGNLLQKVEATEVADALYVVDFPECLLLSDFQNCPDSASANGPDSATANGPDSATANGPDSATANGPDSAYKRDGWIEIAFRFLSNYSASVHCNRVGQIGFQEDFDELCQNIQTMYTESESTDFILKFDDVSIRVHKSVLYARSKFFEEFFAKNEDATEFSVPDTTSAIMHEVLLYIYGGELRDSKIESIVNVFKVAYLLNIPSLKEMCLDYFDEIDAWEVIEGMKFFEYKIEDYI